MAHFSSSRDPDEKVCRTAQRDVSQWKPAKQISLPSWACLVTQLSSAGSTSDLYRVSAAPPQMRLGNSSRSPTIAGLVLEHLCPSIQNILEDGLRDHKLDLIIGQRRNNSWGVVEVSTRIGKRDS